MNLKLARNEAGNEDMDVLGEGVRVVPTYVKIVSMDWRYCSMLRFEMGSLLSACTLEQTRPANI